MDDRRGPGRSLEILRVKERLDAYFRAGESAKAEALLRYWEAETRASGDRRGLLEILSEEIGFFRDPDEADSAIACAREAAEIVYGEKMEEGVSGATILLNAATTENAFGDKQRARSLFGQAKRVLERELPAGTSGLPDCTTIWLPSIRRKTRKGRSRILRRRSPSSRRRTSPTAKRR